MPLVNPVPVFNFTVMFMNTRANTGSSVLGAVTAGISAAVSVGMGFLTGSFSEVSGLNTEMETEEYHEGGWNKGPRRFFKKGRYPNLVFRRGVTSNTDLWDWSYQVVHGNANPVRKSGLILLLDRGGGVTGLTGMPTGLGLPVVDRTPVAAWMFYNALPERLQGPSLNAKNNEIAIESMELTHEGLHRVGPSMIPLVGDFAASIGL